MGSLPPPRDVLVDAYKAVSRVKAVHVYDFDNTRALSLNLMPFSSIDGGSVHESIA